MLFKLPSQNYRNQQNSFGKHLLNLYHNDMPVMITSDMMLYALHRFYDESLEKMEIQLIDELKDLCKSMLTTLHNIDISQLSEDKIKYFKGIELYLLIPYFLLESQVKYFDDYSKFNNYDDAKLIVNKIRNFELKSCKINNIEFTFDQTTFKPRGHYIHNIKLKNYFMAFTWFSKCVVKLNTKFPGSYLNGFIFSAFLSKIAEKSFDKVKKIEDFVEKIIGKPDGYTLSSFLNEINVYDNKPFNELTFFESVDQLSKNVILTKKCTLIKVGDNGFTMNESNKTEFCFSLIGKGSTYDNTIINSLIDIEFFKYTGLDRKFPSIFDITYALFDNVDTIDFVKDRINNRLVYHNLISFQIN